MHKLLVLTTVFFLAGCLPQPVAVSKNGVVYDPARTNGPAPAKNNIISEVYDYGPQVDLEGCTVKYVYTTNHPNFWFVKCPNGKVSTSYDTGGKHPTRASAGIE